MTNEAFALPAIQRQSGEIDVVRPGHSVVSRIAADAHKHLSSPDEKLWRAGDYEVNGGTYRRIKLPNTKRCVWLYRQAHSVA